MNENSSSWSLKIMLINLIYRSKQLQIAKLRVNMNLMKDQLDEAVADQNFLSAQEIKSKMDQLEEEQIMLEGQLAAAKTAGMAPPAKPAAVGTPVASNPAAGQIDDSGPDPDNPAVTLKCLRLIVSTLQVSSAATVIKCIGITI